MAFIKPATTFDRSNGSFEPSRLTTDRLTSSRRSNVVNRRPHRRHSRRRRTEAPASEERESTTLSSGWPHHGQRIEPSPGKERGATTSSGTPRVSRHILTVKPRHNPFVPSQADLVLRLLLASALAGLLGGERDPTDQPAGLRTHIPLGLGAAPFAVISAYGFETVVGSGHQGVQADPTRVASQIVVGIGFLGGGAIIKYGASIRGLTTAASLWVTAAVGTAVGIGQLALGSVTTAITLLALVGLRPLRRLIRRYARDRDEYIVEARRDVDVAAMLS